MRHYNLYYNQVFYEINKKIFIFFYMSIQIRKDHYSLKLVYHVPVRKLQTLKVVTFPIVSRFQKHTSAPAPAPPPVLTKAPKQASTLLTLCCRNIFNSPAYTKPPINTILDLSRRMSFFRRSFFLRYFIKIYQDISKNHYKLFQIFHQLFSMFLNRILKIIVFLGSFLNLKQYFPNFQFFLKTLKSLHFKSFYSSPNLALLD